MDANREFNNLLTVIGGYGRMLMAEAQTPLTADRALQIVKAGEKAAELTKQLRLFSRKKPIAPVPVNLNEFVADGADDRTHRGCGYSS